VKAVPGEFFWGDIGSCVSGCGCIGDDVSHEVVELLLDSLHVLVLVYKRDQVGTALVLGSLMEVSGECLQHCF
jgi:hypothetical protein